MKIVRDGYEKTGQYPVNFVAAMNQCPAVKHMSMHDFNHMKNSVDQLANIFRTRGILTEADMDALLIIDQSEDSRKTPKDERVLHQQRAVLMNSAECIRQYKEYHERLQAKKASSGRVAAPNGSAPLSDAQLYNSWCFSLSHNEAREEAKNCEAAGGKVSRRKQKAAELRAQGWTQAS